MLRKQCYKNNEIKNNVIKTMFKKQCYENNVMKTNVMKINVIKNGDMNQLKGLLRFVAFCGFVRHAFIREEYLCT
jgi:hypothetical protein